MKALDVLMLGIIVCFAACFYVGSGQTMGTRPIVDAHTVPGTTKPSFEVLGPMTITLLYATYDGRHYEVSCTGNCDTLYVDMGSVVGKYVKINDR
jgi:hypothetical protein